MRAVLLPLLLTACSRRTDPAAVVSPALAAPSTEAQVAVALGDWSSSSCGARDDERVLHLKPGGEAVAEDRVSPCPPGAQCVWSGVLAHLGTWRAEVGRVALTWDQVDPRGAPPTLPSSLIPRGEEMVDDAGCVHVRILRRSP